MLCFLTTTSKVAGRKLPYDWVLRQLDDAYAMAADRFEKEDICLRVWVLITIAFTVAGVEKEWFKEAWGKIQSEVDQDWASVKKYLMRVMWFEAIHDGPGEAVWRDLERTISS